MRGGRAFLFVVAAGGVLTLLGHVDGLSAVAAAAVTVASSVILALIAHGGAPLATEAVTFGASGALAYEAARPYLPLVAAGMLLTFVFGSRAMRSRSWRELAFHLGAAFLGGASASWVAQSHAGFESTLLLVAIVMAALLASVPWIVPSDAPRTFALRKLAARARGPFRVCLLRAAIAHRRIADAEVPRAVLRRVDRAFDELCRRTERQLERRIYDRVDTDLRASVDQLVRVSRAVCARERLLEGLDSQALIAVDSDGLEAEVAALAELA